MHKLLACLLQALPAFGAEHFGMAADLARGGGCDSGSAQQGRSLEVCRAAEAAHLQRLTQQAPLDYAAVAAVSCKCCCCCVACAVLCGGFCSCMPRQTTPCPA